MQLVHCDAGGHDVHADDIAWHCDETGEASCYDCQDRNEAEVLADIYAERDAINAMDAALLDYDPNTVDFHDAADQPF